MYDERFNSVKSSQELHIPADRETAKFGCCISKTNSSFDFRGFIAKQSYAVQLAALRLASSTLVCMRCGTVPTALP